jgi:hypothetical protein
VLAGALVSLLLTQAEPLTPSAAESEIERARVLITNLDEEKALGVLARVIAIEALPTPLRSRAQVYAGIAHLNVGAEQTAHDDFRKALELDGAATLPDWASRRVRMVFETEVKALLRPAPRPSEPLTPKAVTVTPTPVVEPLPPMRERPRWVPAAFGAGMLVGAAFSTVGFARFADQFAQAKVEPVALTAQRMDASARVWLVVGEVAVAAAIGCAVGIWVWWLAP